MVCILVVEDDHSVREILSDIILDAGYQIVEADSADSAVDLLNDPRVRLLVTDINLPGTLNGIDLAHAAREVHKDIPVIFISGRPTNLANARAVSDPAAFLQKPFRLLELIAAVERLIVTA